MPLSAVSSAVVRSSIAQLDSTDAREYTTYQLHDAAVIRAARAVVQVAKLEALVIHPSGTCSCHHAAMLSQRVRAVRLRE